jgi:thioredoxin reductase (NADPH)
MKTSKVLIIGSGPAGYAAAIYSSRAGLSPLMISGIEPGGQLMITTEVENYPGYENPIQGPWLMEQMKKQSEAFGTKIINDYVTDVDFSQFPFVIRTEKDKYLSYSVIIATGAKAKWLGIPGEDKFMGFGVSACATCDGFFFKNKDVVVVGGGNTAVEEALYLSNICKKVTLIHRRDKLRAEKILQNRLFEKKNVEIIWNSQLKEIHGNKENKLIEKIVIKNTSDNNENQIILDGLFVAIGHKPATEIFLNKLEIDEEGYILTKADSTKTSIDGVFAAGDVTDKIYRQAVTAAGMGCMGALEAEKFLSNKKIS